MAERQTIASVGLYPVLSKLFGLEGRSVVKFQLNLDIESCATIQTTELVKVDTDELATVQRKYSIVDFDEATGADTTKLDSQWVEKRPPRISEK